MSKLDQLRALGEAKRKAKVQVGGIRPTKGEDTLEGWSKIINRKPNAFEDAARGRDPLPNPDGSPKGKKPPMVSRPVPPSPSGAKRGRGRPKVEGKRPWEAEGVSRRTWYRRQKESRQ